MGQPAPTVGPTVAAAEDAGTPRPLPAFRDLPGEAFEEWIAVRLDRLGFHVARTPRSRDGGIDLIATRPDTLGIETRLLLQCKNRGEPAGVSVVRELRGVIPDRSAGTTPVLACPGGFTADAKTFAAAHGVRLWGRAELSELDRQASLTT